MIVYYLNKQNKLNEDLFEYKEYINGNERLDWYAFAINSHHPCLNKRINKLAPRRHKKRVNRVLDDLKDKIEKELMEEFRGILENE